MSDDVKRRRRWLVRLYNPLALGNLGPGFETGPVSAEGASMGRAFNRALEAAGEGYLTNPHDFCGAAVHAFEMAREAMMRRSAPAYRVTVTIRGFSVEIERIR